MSHMKFYIRLLKSIIDLGDEAYTPIRHEREVHFSIPKIDLLYAEPGITRTHTCVTWISPYEPQRILLALNAYDLLSVMAAAHMIWEVAGKKPKRKMVHKLFYQSADEALKNAVRTAFPSLSAPGETGYYRFAQWAAEPYKWAAFHAASRNIIHVPR